MKLYWRERRAGQRLILADDEETEVEVGAVRQTPRGFDALAKTNTYDPGRAQKGFPSIDEAKAFVESFRPWDIFGGDWEMEVESEVRPNPAAASSPPAEASSQESELTGTATEGATSQSAEDEEPARGSGWRFWKKD